MTEESVQMIYDMSADRIRETETSFHRYLFDEIDWDSRVVALDGPRGVGKTTMLLQHLRENRNESDSFSLIYFINCCHNKIPIM